MISPDSGKYENVVDFINRNNLQDEFKNAVSGDRTIEQYVADYAHIPDLTQNILNDLGVGNSVKFDKKSRTSFTFKK